MSLIAILGDVHGDWHAMDIVLKSAIGTHNVDAVLQVGDFGYEWPGQKCWTPSKRRFKSLKDKKFPDDLPMYWVDGNHENFDVLFEDYGESQPRWTYIERGTTVNFEDIGTVLGIGGANSIDRDIRTPGHDWWPEEYPNYGDQIRAIRSVDAGPIHAVVSHEHPERFPYYDPRLNSSLKKEGEITRMLLDSIFQEAKPKFWFFGHHHDFNSGITDGCFWACAPIITSFTYLLWDGSSVWHCKATYGEEKTLIYEND